MAVVSLIAGYSQETRQIDKPNRLAVWQVNEPLHLEFSESTADRFERRTQVIRDISPRKQQR